MALMKVSGSGVTVEFNGRERTWLRRGEVTVPLAAVRRVTPVETPLRAAHGARSGLQISGFAKIGVWGIMTGPRQLVAAYRGRPGLHILLDRGVDGVEYDELVLSLDGAEQLAEALGQRLGKGR
ncbi:hypothetical protein [Streptomyces sp. NPDC056987]|uniref:hypothetical protein n=1 Tax=Streptomyces sp. NPDC056987 TaxID=3345988 RepID=UPI0036402955